MKAIILVLILSIPCYAIEKLEAEGRVSATIISQELAEVTPEGGTVVLSADGEIENIIF